MTSGTQRQLQPTARLWHRVKPCDSQRARQHTVNKLNGLCSHKMFEVRSLLCLAGAIRGIGGTGGRQMTQSREACAGMSEVNCRQVSGTNSCRPLAAALSTHLLLLTLLPRRSHPCSGRWSDGSEVKRLSTRLMRMDVIGSNLVSGLSFFPDVKDLPADLAQIDGSCISSSCPPTLW